MARERKADRVADDLLRRIVSGALAAGSRLGAWGGACVRAEAAPDVRPTKAAREELALRLGTGLLVE